MFFTSEKSHEKCCSSHVESHLQVLLFQVDFHFHTMLVGKGTKQIVLADLIKTILLVPSVPARVF